MKNNKKLKTLALILMIILIGILAFAGIYNVASVSGNNLIRNYKVGMNLKGRNVIRLKVDDAVNEVTYDSEGNVVEEQEDEGEYTVAQEPINEPDSLNKENYEKTKKIIEDRLNYLEAQEYKIRFNEENGTIELELIEDQLTDYIVAAISTKGEFKIIDEETEEVLMDKSDVKKTSIVYSSTESSSSTTTYLDIEFNKDGAKKLEELSKTYVTTTEQVVNEEGETEDKTTKKQITVEIDDDSLITTSFGETLTNGHLYISIGQGTTSTEELQKYALQASIQAAIIGTDTIPLAYTVEQNEYILENVNQNIITLISIIAIGVEAIVLILVFKARGIVATILQIGYVALLLLTLKYTNVYITIEGIFGIVVASLINMAYMFRVLSVAKKDGNISNAINESLIKFVNMSIPALIVSITFCFAKWLEINSFGMVMFWGFVVALLYSIVFTKAIFKNAFDK